MDPASRSRHTVARNRKKREETKMNPSRRSLMIAGAAVASASLAATVPARAAVNTKLVDYNADIGLEGYLAIDESVPGKRPGILVAHTRRGIQDFVREQTRELAKLGYVALAADFYGKGVRPLEDDPSARESAKMKNDRAMTRARIRAGYDVLRAHPLVQDGKIAVIGYCIGGLVALELARAGTPLLATAVFHGTLTTPTPDDAKNIKGRVLVMHGADDPTAPLTEVDSLIKEMRDARVDFQLELYGGVKHGFTEPHNNDPRRSAFYNERAARQSWASMQTLFNEVFKA
jgi:dienelactone hydrolase